MKTAALALSLLLPLPVFAQQSSEHEMASREAKVWTPSLSAEGESGWTAPPENEAERGLKRTAVAGEVAAGAGAGLLAYAVVAAVTGPIGWAAAVIYVGSMTAYLAHRRLQGKEDFPPGA